MPLVPRRNPQTRRGLTLMELVVVMSILIALAAIIVPILPGLLGRAERSSRATNSQEIYKTLQLYEAMYTHFPSDYDSLTDGTAACTYVGGTTGTTPALAVTALTAPQTKALTAAGINRLQLMATDPTTVTGADDTFSPYQNQTDRSAAIIDLTSTTSTTPSLMTLTAAGQAQLNLIDSATATPTGVFVVFGLGKRCSIVGVGMNEAPVNFFDSAALSPNTRYERYGLVFQVHGLPNTGSNTPIDFLKAKLVRVFRFGGTLGTGDDAIRDYWSDVAQGDGA